MVLSAKQLEATGHYDAAEDCYKQAREMSPQHPGTFCPLNTRLLAHTGQRFVSGCVQPYTSDVYTTKVV